MQLLSNPNAWRWKAKPPNRDKCVSHMQSSPNEGLASLLLSCYLLRFRKSGTAETHSLMKVVVVSLIKSLLGNFCFPTLGVKGGGVETDEFYLPQAVWGSLLLYTQLANWMVWSDWNTSRTEKLKPFKVTPRCVVNMYKCAFSHSVIWASPISVMPRHDKGCLLKEALINKTSFRSKELKAEV